MLTESLSRSMVDLRLEASKSEPVSSDLLDSMLVQIPAAQHCMLNVLFSERQSSTMLLPKP